MNDESNLDRELNHLRSQQRQENLEASVGHQNAAIGSRVSTVPSVEGGLTISEQMFGLADLDEQHIKRIFAAVPGGRDNVENVYPLSPLQEGMLFHCQLNEEHDTYVLSLSFQLESRAQIGKFSAAVQKVVDRHESLRTGVFWEGLPRPVQVVCRDALLPVVEKTSLPVQNVSEQLTELMKPRGRRFHLQRAPLVRVEIISQAEEQRCYALLFVHHLVCDHRSLQLIAAETMTILAGKEQSLFAPMPFREHVTRALAQTPPHHVEKFFTSKLSGVEEASVPFGITDVLDAGVGILDSKRVIDGELALRVREQARNCGVSAARLFHAAWALVVAKTSGCDDVVFGTVIGSAPQSRLRDQPMLGLFVNTLPLRIQLHGASVIELVRHTQSELTQLVEHVNASLAVAQRCGGGARKGPLFTSLLNYRYSRSDAGPTGTADVHELGRGEAWTNYPITMTVDDLDREFVLSAYTDRRIDPGRVAAYLYTAIGSLTAALAQAPQAAALSLSILPEWERSLVLEQFNATACDYARTKLINGLFEEQVERTPTAVAVEHHSDWLSYSDLNKRSDDLAARLRNCGIGPDQVVGICTDRGIEMTIALVSVLKAGGAYLPLDPSYPAERLAYMLTDAAPKVVLTQQHLLSRLPATPAQLIVLSGNGQSALANQQEVWRPAGHKAAPLNLVYVIYTSGSTGRPKGTAMSHQAMVNLIEWQRRALPNNGSPARTLQFAALSFDVAFQEVFSTLCTGGTLVLLDEWTRRDARALSQLLAGECVERLFLPPLMLQSLAENLKETEASTLKLKDVITAGEQLRISPEIRNLFRLLPGCRLHNHYGPTESHVVATLTLDGDPHSWPEIPPIGRPIANTKLFVLDALGEPAPVGVTGEIYIGGANLARSYLNNPQLTSMRFSPEQFGTGVGGRVYRTGDLGRWRADGAIEYLGRNDNQVKIRGFRIELGELEAQLVRHPSVKEAVVTVHESPSTDRRLVAYITSRASDPLKISELRAHVKDELPDYMTPSAFVVLDCMPLTANGKLDRRALPSPQFDESLNRHYEAPATTTERLLAGFWQQLLGAQSVSRDDDFFDLGGHSLLAMQLLARIQSSLLIEVPIRLVFQFPTLRVFSEQIDSLRGNYITDNAEEGGEELRELVQRVDAMSEGEVHKLLGELARGGQQ